MASFAVGRNRSKRKIKIGVVIVIVLSVDHGNKQIKTTSESFSSGLLESSVPPALDDETLRYKGKYYTISEQRIPFMS